MIGDRFPGESLDPPVLSSLDTIDVTSDVGSIYLHRDDEVITPTIATTGCWEPAEADFLRRVLRPGDTFLDVGANIGYFTLLAHRSLARGVRCFPLSLSSGT